MISYKKNKKIQQIKNKTLDMILFPIRVILTPIYKIHKKYKSKKRYSYKTILKLVQYCIDYHLNHDDYIYVAFTNWVSEECEDYGIYGYSSLCDIF